MSTPNKQQQMAIDIALVCLVSMSVMKTFDLCPSQVGVSTPDGGLESLADIIGRLSDSVNEMVMEFDDDSKEAMADLLAKVGGAA